MKYAALAALTLALSATSAFAVMAIDSYDVGPNDLVEAGDFATSMFGYDWDQDKPIGVGVAGPSGFGESCFWSNVQGSLAGGPRDYTSLRLNLTTMFGGAVTLGDLDSISFYTKNNVVGQRDWQYKIYTAGTTNWYGHRFNGVVPSNADTDWHLWDSDTNMPVNDIYDGSTLSYVTVPGGGYFSELTTWADEEILFIDIIAGYATNSPPIDSYLDGVTITVGGQIAELNLVPEPATLSLLGLVAMGLIRRR